MADDTNNPLMASIENFKQAPTVDQTEEQDKIARDFSIIDEADRKVGLDKKLMNDRVRQMKIEALKKLYNMMIDLGVDPSSLDSVGQFVQQLEETSPDLVMLLASAIENLDPEANDTKYQILGQAAAQEGEQSMDDNETGLPLANPIPEGTPPPTGGGITS